MGDEAAVRLSIRPSVLSVPDLPSDVIMTS